MAGGGSFDTVADEYDAARPTYPGAVFDALGPLGGRRVLDVGAGTGIATRELVARGADVVAVEPGGEVLRRARARTPGLVAVIADGAVLPVRSGSIDLPQSVSRCSRWVPPSPATVSLSLIASQPPGPERSRSTSG